MSSHIARSPAPRANDADNTADNVLDTVFMISVVLLCTMILAVAVLHCILWRRKRERSGNWASCRTLNIIPSCSFSGDGKYSLQVVFPQPLDLKGGYPCYAPAPLSSDLAEKAIVDEEYTGRSCTIPFLVPIATEGHRVPLPAT